LRHDTDYLDGSVPTEPVECLERPDRELRRAEEQSPLC
jgi:hypothetical protein